MLTHAVENLLLLSSRNIDIWIQNLVVQSRTLVEKFDDVSKGLQNRRIGCSNSYMTKVRITIQRAQNVLTWLFSIAWWMRKMLWLDLSSMICGCLQPSLWSILDFEAAWKLKPCGCKAVIWTWLHWLIARIVNLDQESHYSDFETVT